MGVLTNSFNRALNEFRDTTIEEQFKHYERQLTYLIKRLDKIKEEQKERVNRKITPKLCKKLDESELSLTSITRFLNLSALKINLMSYLIS